MKIFIATVSNSIIREIVDLNREINDEFNNILEIKLFSVDRYVNNEKVINMVKYMNEADFIIFDLMGANHEISEYLYSNYNNKNNVISIGGENREIMGLTKLGGFCIRDLKEAMGDKKLSMDDMKTMMIGKKPSMKQMTSMMSMKAMISMCLKGFNMKDMKNYKTLLNYWKSGTKEDIRNLFYLILKEYGGHKSLPKLENPKLIENTTICRPEDKKTYENYDEYKNENKFDESKPNIVILFYSHNYPNKTHKCVGEIKAKFEKIANIIPIAFPGAAVERGEELKNILMNLGLKINLFINFMPFRFTQGPMGGDADSGVNLLKDFNVPIIHPFFMNKKYVYEWIDSVEGLNGMEFLINVMLPELDGCIDLLPIGAMKKISKDNELEVVINELTIIDDRCEKVVEMAKNLINLQIKSNNEKKIAIIGYNYPPGEGNIFGGALLNTCESISNILKFMKLQGYSTNEIEAEELINRFTKEFVNSPRWKEYNKNSEIIKYNKNNYDEELKNEHYKKEMEEQWGRSPGEIMTFENDFLIPGILNKNVFIGIQPSRGIHEDIEKVYHDKLIPPHHQYIAFYKWLREEFKADAIIHIGTHGTLEFLKGKELAMSSSCFPDKLIGTIPHIYLYYIGNPSEGVIAKRRSSATIVSYQTPPMDESDIYGEYISLESLISEYNQCKISNKVRLSEIDELIKCKANELNLEYESYDDIEKELYKIKTSLIPKGLHVFGKGYSEEEAKAYMKIISSYDRGDIKSLERIIAESLNINFDEIIKKNLVSDREKIKVISDNIINKYLLQKTKNTDFENSLRDLNILDKKQEIEEILNFSYEFYLKSMKCEELKGLNKVLNGEYLEAKLAGDIIRNPEILPSGYNIYQFDPRMVPTVSAYNRGKEIAKNTIKEYKGKYNKYPKTIATILWGLETSRTQGETVGQILHYLGVKVDNSNPFNTKFKIIPVSELGRPRINVVINICGFFRDMFPNLLNSFNEIFEKLQSLDENYEENYFKYESDVILKNLLDDGYDEKIARELSIGRIFGPEEGEYGTNLTSIVESKNWIEEEIFGKSYIDKLNHIYTKNYRGKKCDKLFEGNIKSVELISQVRSNPEYEVTDLDHFYEFFGGLSKSVEITRGEKAEVYITDTTSHNIETQTVDKAILRGARTRLLNPKWINSMVEHKYHGVQEIKKRFENILGLAATTNKVENWIFDNMNATYIEDKNLKNILKENNKWAYFEMVETLIECNQRGYWNTSEDVLKKLRKTCLEIEGAIEEEI